MPDYKVAQSVKSVGGEPEAPANLEGVGPYRVTGVGRGNQYKCHKQEVSEGEEKLTLTSLYAWCGVLHGGMWAALIESIWTIDESLTGACHSLAVCSGADFVGGESS